MCVRASWPASSCSPPTPRAASTPRVSCRMADELPAALTSASRHQREPHEFDDVTLVLDSFERTPLVDNVVEYSFFVQVGPGPHDLIRLHRIVQEKAPCKPISSPHPVFLVHGIQADFRTTFLGSLLSSQVPREQALAVFLAQRNLDVWGLDMRSALVPADIMDFSFLQDWNYATDIHDIAISLGLARRLRNLTGGEGRQFVLLGHSNGGMIVYAYVNDETRFRPEQRHVKGLIPVDIFFKLSPADEPARQDACTRAAFAQSFLDAGALAVDNTSAKPIGFLAATAPNAPSPFIPQFTNRTVALLSGAASWAISFPPGYPPYRPFYHLLAGQFDPVSGLPTDFTYTRAAYFFDLLQAVPPWYALREFFELSAIPCNEVDLPYDDHLGEVTVPVLYVGAEGGFGHVGEYTTTLLGSKDVTVLNVSLLPQQPLDFGHADLLWADNAPTVAWEPIYQWLRSH